ncbi:M61 family metallopeptidase [Serpentinimonas barnesii]|uniref:M61 family metallopeptidase n=1 Tax=Serpentinimonas barnesii TaxID=1458427 RepID=UPI0009E2C08D|nr:M61 family metallopeptidase [Serpentinimonas barnesii]
MPKPAPTVHAAAPALPTLPPSAPGPRYRVDLVDLHAHLYQLSLFVTQPARLQRLSLPVWIPGSYLVREFSQHLQGLSADCDGHAVPLRQLNKNTWEAATPAGAQVLRLRYQVYAFDASVRSAWLDAERAFFNPTSLCLRVHGQEALAHRIEVYGSAATQGWQAATALPDADADAASPATSPAQTHATPAPHCLGRWQAADYDELADSPFELGRFWSAAFTVRGVPHRLVVSGAGPGFDGARLLRDTEAICQAGIAFWHGAQEAPPFGHYLFLLNARFDGYGGLEHRHSTALICRRNDLPQCSAPSTQAGAASPAALSASEGYTALLGLISHEYFHTWHVKRLRPQAFARYDYDGENYTELLWLFEGFTSYYDDLLLRRAGLIDEACHLQLLSKTLNQVLQSPGRLVHSLAQASFEAWTKYYRVTENSPNATVSYYAKGALVALALDLQLRAEGRSTLDEVLRALYRRCQGGPMQEADLLAVLEQCAGRSYAAEIQAWVHGCADLLTASGAVPGLPELLRAQGIDWQTEPARLAQRLGLRVSETEGLQIKNVLRGSLAEQAGLAAGDEWLGIEVEAAPPPAGDTTLGATPTPTSAWRVRKLDDVAQCAHGLSQIVALVARDGRLLRLPLRWPDPASPETQTVRLVRAALLGSATEAAPAARTATAPAHPHPDNAIAPTRPWWPE